MGYLNMMVYYFISEWVMRSVTVFVNLSLCYEVTNLSDFYLWIITCFGFKERWCSRHCRSSVANLTCRLLVTVHLKFSRENPVVSAFCSLKIECVLSSAHTCLWKLFDLQPLLNTWTLIPMLMLLGFSSFSWRDQRHLNRTPNPAPSFQLLGLSTFSCPGLFSFSHILFGNPLANSVSSLFKVHLGFSS